MTYDFFGAWAAQRPTAPHSPLTSYAAIPQAGYNSDEPIANFKASIESTSISLAPTAVIAAS